MTLVDAPYAPQLVGCRLVVEVADQGVTRVGGHGQHTASGQQLTGPLEQAPLRVFRVDVKQLGHDLGAV